MILQGKVVMMRRARIPRMRHVYKLISPCHIKRQLSPTAGALTARWARLSFHSGGVAPTASLIGLFVWRVGRLEDFFLKGKR